MGGTGSELDERDFYCVGCRRVKQDEAKWPVQIQVRGQVVAFGDVCEGCAELLGMQGELLVLTDGDDMWVKPLDWPRERQVLDVPSVEGDTERGEDMVRKVEKGVHGVVIETRWTRNEGWMYRGRVELPGQGTIMTGRGWWKDANDALGEVVAMILESGPGGNGAG